MKLPNGYGSVVYMGKKRRKPYAAIVTVGWTDEGKQIRKYIGAFRTRAEALTALANYNQNPFDMDLRKLTFAEVYEQWSKQKYRGAPVRGEYVAAYKNLSGLHKMRFAEIRKRHIQAVIDACPLSFQAKSQMKSLCTQMYRFAIDLEIVATNYASLVELPAKVESEIHKPFTPVELERLWQHDDEPAAQVALILCYTGLRPSELAQIRTADVKLAERYMRGGMKTKAGKNRVIPLAEKIVPLIERFYNPVAEYLLNLDGEPVLNGQKLRAQIWDKNPLLSGHLPHDGRHTCATLLDNADVPKKIQQLILGHAAQDITGRVYTHKTLDQLIEAINRI